ncbi:hypothetical protein HY480_01175 [Candidatus Uhrbacteria bacterium]|nr:hypothetical protein [Candidatus Uhrbacteria bacterium]
MAFFRDDPKVATYVPTPISATQVEALEACIRASPDASPFAKRVIIWMLRQTERLTIPVALSLPPELYGESARSVAFSAHDMVSANGRTHLDQVLRKGTTQFHLMGHDGQFVFDGYTHSGPTGLPAKPRPVERGWKTLWWSYVWYDHHPRLLRLPSREQLAAIDVG